ncbi:MAG TPA: GyrI-like domain-containing protein [Acidobacteriaceae bacterium]|nr:GyrI-like domain-containing protein [Acidobacteriaceae bacterium]
MNLTEVPESVSWPATHYAFVEKIGPFQTNAPQAWQALHQFVAGIAEHNQITGYMSLYKIGSKVYRAGVSLAAPSVKLPPEVSYMEFSGGKYSRFVLTGPYSDLARASGRVVEIISETRLPLRDDYFIENYVNDPRKTPEDQLITEILIPTM